MTDRWLATSLIILCALGLAACGSGSGDTSTTAAGGSPSSGQGGSAGKHQAPGGDGQGAATKGGGEGGSATAGQSPPAKEPEPKFRPHPHHDSAGGSKQFEAKGGDNSIQEYGSEPSSSEFEEAARIVHEYFDARAEGAWAVACAKLSPAVTESLVQQLGAAEGAKKAGCAEVLAGLTAGVPPAVLKEAAVADIGALRAEGDSGFVLFRGSDGEAFFVPVRREGGSWKVAAIAASSLG